MSVPRLTPESECVESCTRKEKARTLRSAVVRICVIVCIGASSSLPAQSAPQNPHDVIKPALVHLTATVNDTNNLHDAYATGVVISADGLVLTSYRLLSDLGNHDQKQLAIIATVNGQTVPAVRVDVRESLNLLLLQLPGSSYPKASLRGSVPAADESDDVYTSGYTRLENHAEYASAKGTLRRDESPDNILRGTTISFTKAQLGSPVYDGAGKLFGVANWWEGEAGTYFTPIHYADALIPYVRMSDVNATIAKMIELDESFKTLLLGTAALQVRPGKSFQERIGQMEAAIDLLRKQLDWQPPLLNKIDRTITLRYIKLLSGDPHVGIASVQVTPLPPEAGPGTSSATRISSATPTLAAIPPLPPIEATVRVDDSQQGAILDISAFYQDMEDLNRMYSIAEFAVRVVPVLKDGTSLEPVELEVSF